MQSRRRNNQNIHCDSANNCSWTELRTSRICGIYSIDNKIVDSLFDVNNDEYDECGSDDDANRTENEDEDTTVVMWRHGLRNVIRNVCRLTNYVKHVY